MRQKEIIDGMKDGGRIVNHIYVKPDNTVGDTVTDRQIESLEKKGKVIKTVGYDKTRTYRGKA